MIQYIFLGIISLIVLIWLGNKMKLQFDTRDLIAWTILVALTVGTYISWSNSLDEFQIWFVALIFAFIFTVLLSYYDIIFKE